MNGSVINRATLCIFILSEIFPFHLSPAKNMERYFNRMDSWETGLSKTHLTNSIILPHDTTLTYNFIRWEACQHSCIQLYITLNKSWHWPNLSPVYRAVFPNTSEFVPSGHWVTGLACTGPGSYGYTDNRISNRSKLWWRQIDLSEVLCVV